MPTLPEFKLEAHFSRWEFTARYHLTASDVETMSIGELLSLAECGNGTDLDQLRLGYTQTYGAPDVREAIARTYNTIEPADVICFAGAQEGIYTAVTVLLEPGDHAVVITPHYQPAETIARSICDVSGVHLHAETGWSLNIDEFERALRSNTRLVSIDVPNNPTGAIPSRDTFARIVEICDERGITLLSDEVYRGIEADGAKTLPQAADLSRTALSLNDLSKAFGLPGLRIGWIASRNRALLARFAGAKHYTSICNSAPSEALALIALRASEQILSRNKGIVAGNTPIFADFFEEFSDLFCWAPPDGGCVSYPSYLGHDGVEAMCKNVLADAGVLLLPASIFATSLTESPRDRFRIGIGRRAPEEALEAFGVWLRTR